MFSSRKPLEVPPSKRFGSDALTSSSYITSKRPRLLHTPTANTSVENATIASDGAADIGVLDMLPTSFAEEVRACAVKRILSCRTHNDTHQNADVFYIAVLPTRLLLWSSEGKRETLSLSLPDQISPVSDTMTLYPFVFSLYGSSLSLLLVCSSGLVALYDDIEAPFESTPLTVQIPLQSPHEHVETSADAIFVGLQDYSQANDESLKSLLCWSDFGQLWEVAIEDHRLRIRTFDCREASLLSGLSKSFSRFLGGYNDSIVPLRQVQLATTGSNASTHESANMLLLSADGSLELRSFNTADVMDPECSLCWKYDALTAAKECFFSRFTSRRLHHTRVLSIAYENQDTVGLLVSFSWQGDGNTFKLSYALVHCSKHAPNRALQVASFHLLDYEVSLSHPDEANELTHTLVECYPVTDAGVYIVWTCSMPVQIASIRLPSADTELESSCFALQSDMTRTPHAFNCQITSSPLSPNALRASLSFILLDGSDRGPSCTLCLATASAMQQIERRVRTQTPKVSLPPATGQPEVQEYVQQLSNAFLQSMHGGLPNLRTKDSELPMLAEAAVSLALQIVDVTPATGLRWGVQEPSVQSLMQATPKLVRFQLEEKRSRLKEFVEFLQLQCPSLWGVLQASSDLSDRLAEGKEKLDAAVALSKLQHSLLSGEEDAVSGRFLLHAIEKTVEMRGHSSQELELAGYNAFDIFFSEASNVADLLPCLISELQKMAASVGRTDLSYLHALLETGHTITSMLQSLSFAGKEARGRWLFAYLLNDQVLTEQVSRLGEVVGYIRHASDEFRQVEHGREEVADAAKQLEALASLLLKTYERYLMKLHGDDTVVKQELVRVAPLVLNPLIYVATSEDKGSSVSAESAFHRHAELFASARKLCEEHAYYEGMAHLAQMEDKDVFGELDYVFPGESGRLSGLNRLEEYCQTYDGFQQFLMQWCGGDIERPWPAPRSKRASSDHALLAYLLSNSKMEADAYVKTHERLGRFAWITSIRVDKYGESGKAALVEAKEEEEDLGRRRTMASIAKIAAMAADETDQETEEKAARELIRTRVQQSLQDLPIDLAIDSVPLKPESLVDRCLEAESIIPLEDPLRSSVFVMALEVLDSLASEPSRLCRNLHSLRLKAWRQALHTDRSIWKEMVEEYISSANEDKIEELMRQTLVFNAMKRYVKLMPTSVESAALTREMVETLTDGEAESGEDVVFSPRCRQLVLKALDLARN